MFLLLIPFLPVSSSSFPSTDKSNTSFLLNLILPGLTQSFPSWILSLGRLSTWTSYSFLILWQYQKWRLSFLPDLFFLILSIFFFFRSPSSLSVGCKFWGAKMTEFIIESCLFLRIIKENWVFAETTSEATPSSTTNLLEKRTDFRKINIYEVVGWRWRENRE